jgi:hypothetical protein
MCGHKQLCVVGHLYARELMLCMWQIIYGLIAPLPPLVSQAIGAGEAPSAGLWLQACSAVLHTAT